MTLKLIIQKNTALKTLKVKTSGTHQHHCFSKTPCANDDHLIQQELASPSSVTYQLPPTLEHN